MGEDRAGMRGWTIILIFWVAFVTPRLPSPVLAAPVATAPDGRGSDEAAAAVTPLERAIDAARVQRRRFDKLVSALAAARGDTGRAGEGDREKERLLLERIVPPPAAFTRSIEARGDEREFLLVERYDPARPRGERWKVLKRQPTDEPGVKKPEHRGADGTFGLYVSMVSALSAEDARFLGRDEAGRQRWQLARVPSGVLGPKVRGFADRLSAQVLVDDSGDEPFVAELNLATRRPFRTRGIAKVRRFESRFVFAPLVGRPELKVPREIETLIDVSILLLGSERGHTRIRYDDYVLREVAKKGIAIPPRGGE